MLRGGKLELGRFTESTMIRDPCENRQEATRTESPESTVPGLCGRPLPRGEWQVQRPGRGGAPLASNEKLHWETWLNHEMNMSVCNCDYLFPTFLPKSP